MKRFSIIYLILAVLMITLLCGLYNAGYTMGHQFHDLSSFQRMTIRIQAVLTTLISPFSAVFGSFFPSKPIFNSSIWWDISMYLGIIPSYFTYLRIFGFTIKKARA